MDKNCAQCGVLFPTKHADKTYCSRPCKEAARSRRQGKKPRKSVQAGQRFNRLVLVAPAQESNNHSQWLCDCDCGTKNFPARLDKLKDGRVQSCGCLRTELAKDAHERRLQRLEKQRTERQAEKEALREAAPKPQPPADIKKIHETLKWLLTQEQVPKHDPLWSVHYFAALLQDNTCHYCQGPLPDKGVPLDEVDSDELFGANNVVPVCFPCTDTRKIFNRNLTFEEMELLGETIELILLRRGK
jgi:hypothetical protein